MGDMRADMAERYGFRKALTVKTVEVMDESHPDFHLANGSFHPDKQRLLVSKEAEFRTAVHETFHSMGGPTSMRAASGAARHFEESATEVLTQHYLDAGDYLKLSRPASAAKPLLERVVDIEGSIDELASQLPGSYPRWRSRIHLAIAHASDAWDGPTVQRLTEEAATLWKRGYYDTADGAYEAFVKALKPKSDEHREFLDRMFKTKWGRSSP